MSEARWIELGRYAGHFEADIDREMLEAAGIPVLVKGPLTGAFGPGFVGWTPEGIRLYVPSELHDEARALLAGESNGDSDDAA